MATVKKKTQAEIQYAKELRRIKQFISRAEKRDYRFSDDVIPQKPQKIGSRSVQKLKHITPKELYKKATALTETGDIVSGTQKRLEERRISAQKSAETRRRNLEKLSKPSTVDFETKQRHIDEQNLEKLREEEYSKQFTEGEIVYRGILNMIEISGMTRSSDHLKRTLQDIISSQGREETLRRIGQNKEEVTALCQYALMYDINNEGHRSAIRNLEMMLRGRPLTLEEARNIEDIMDADTSY